MGPPSNLSRMIAERAMRPAEAEVTRHDQLGEVRFCQPAAPSHGAARTRHYRERRRRGDIVITFPVLGAAVADLVALGWLDATARGDRGAVRSAVIRLARRALALRLRPG
jgi:hypothetical protein